MNHKIYKLAEIIQNWAQKQSQVRALFWYGGYGYGRIFANSDLDVALLLYDKSINHIAQSLVETLEYFGEEIAHSIIILEDNRIAIWVGSSLIKIDIVVAYRTDDLQWLASAEDVPEPRLKLAYPVNDPEIELLIERASKPIDVNETSNRRSKAEQEIKKFVIAFDACSNAHAKSDAFQFYFQYNLALGRLARIIQLTRDGYKHLYLPRQLLARLMSVEEQQKFKKLACSLYLPDALDLKKNLALFFFDTIDEAAKILAIKISIPEVKKIILAIQQRDIFFNIRDISTHFQGLIRSGVMFRSSALSRWSNLDELAKWLKDKKISDIIDLRTDDEIESMPYCGSILQGIKYYNFPIETSNGNKEQYKIAPYFDRMIANKQKVKQALTVIAESTGTTVIHCFFGKDRTGWLCAFIMLLLNLPEKNIIQDYLASQMCVEEQTIVAFLNKVNSNGGASYLAKQFNMPTDVINKIRCRFLINQEV